MEPYDLGAGEAKSASPETALLFARSHIDPERITAGLHEREQRLGSDSIRTDRSRP
jgi:hypothetical protein